MTMPLSSAAFVDEKSLSSDDFSGLDSNVSKLPVRMLGLVKPFVDAGWAIHWLKPNSKMPIGEGWSTKPVASLDALRRRYSEGNNVGVRLGDFSCVDGGYLHVFDVDIRKPALAAEARAALLRLFPSIDFTAFPSVISGSGGESRHIYFVTDQPFKSRKLAKSGTFETVFDPAKGRDVRKSDWEIELFGSGKQVAMPPSIHPGTGQPYRWEREFEFDGFDTPFISSAAVEAAGASVDADDGSAVNDRRLGLTLEQGRAILARLPLDDWCEDRDGWKDAGMALKHEFGEDGYDLWVEFSQQSTKFDAKDQASKWKSFKGKTKRPIRMATLKAAARVAALVDEFDDIDDIDDGDSGFDELIDAPSPAAAADDDFDPKAAEEASVLPWPSLLDVNEEGGLKSTLHNITLIMNHDPRLVGVPQLNQFTKEIVQRTAPGNKKGRKNPAKATRQLSGPVWQVRDTLNGEPWSSARDYSVRAILEAPKTQGGYSIKIPDRDLKGATVLAAWENGFHPIREYLDGVSWDGVPRVDTLFIDYLGADDDIYSREVARLMLVAAVTRVFEPGAKFDTAVILEGAQGTGKSTFIRVLGVRWSSELEGDFHDGKEMVEKIQGGWIIELPELSGFNRSDVQSIKAFISRPTDKVRLAYEARASEFPRQCVLVGSTNDTADYLRDPTGGRRFLPIACHAQSIDNAKLRRNVDQIWAEARTIYAQMRAATPVSEGDLPLYLTNAVAAEMALRLQESRRVESAEDGTAGQIEAWLNKPIVTGDIDQSADGQLRNETCLKELWIDCLGNDERSYNQQSAQMLGRAMRLVPNWKKSTSKITFTKYGQQRFYTRDGDGARAIRLGLIKPASVGPG